jgi:hypothetical protein
MQLIRFEFQRCWTHLEILKELHFPNVGLELDRGPHLFKHMVNDQYQFQFIFLNFKVVRFFRLSPAVSWSVIYMNDGLNPVKDLIG